MSSEFSTPGGRDEADVVVIGAGHTGLVAASYLAAAGLEVVVLESRAVLTALGMNTSAVMGDS